MNLRDLEYFVAVAQYRHFGKAAKFCFASQPTLSGQIKKLEEELGVILFERNNRKVRLSEAGGVIFQKAQKILSQVKELGELAQEFIDPSVGVLHLACIPTMAPYFLPLILPLIKEYFPQLKVYLYEWTTAQIVSALREGRVDIGLLALPLLEKDLFEIPLGVEEFYLGLPKRHPFAADNVVNLSDLRNEKLLLLEEGHCFRHQALEFCRQIGAGENLSFRATSFETIKRMIILNGGLTLVPELTARQWMEHQELAILQFNSPVPSRQVGFIYRNMSAKKNLFDKLASCCEIKIASVLGKSTNQQTILPIVF